MKHIHSSKQKGFTLLEILLVVAAIGILAAIVIVAISPQRQLAKVRNAERDSEVSAIIDAIYQYNIDNGEWPENSTLTNNKGTTYAIGNGGGCDASSSSYTGSASGGNELNFSDDLTPTYVSSLPEDPQTEVSGCTGYEMSLTNDDRIKVSAPRAENGETIEVTQ